MHTIIVVGHPHSNLSAIESLLCGSGMQQPKVSRIQKLSPREIGQFLLKEGRESSTGEPEIQQVVPGDLWNGLALDLFLANTGNGNWGWSDPQAICLLDYWKKSDPKVRFALAYGSPESAFIKAFQGRGATTEEMSAFVRKWCEYNSALLSFYYQNSAACYLANVDALVNTPDRYIDALATKFGVELTLGDSAEVQGKCISPAGLDLHLAKELLKDYPQANAIYEELQSTADLPSPVDDHPTCKLAIWAEQVELIRQASAISQAMDELELSLKDKSDRLHEAELKIESLEDEVRKAQEVASKGGEQENQLLLVQLHLAQEELERLYLASKVPVASVSYSAHAVTKSVNKEQQGHYGAAARVKKQLSYRLGATLIAHSGSFSGWMRMPFALARQVREFESDKKAVSRKLPPLSTYRDAHDAERVRQHLSYRLGAVMLANSRSPIGWLKMPFAMRRELKSFKRSRKGK